MPPSLFVETEAQHAARLAPQSRRQTVLMRRILQHRRAGRSTAAIIAAMGPSNAPAHLLEMTIAALETALDVIWDGEKYTAGSYRATAAAQATQAVIGHLISGDSSKEIRARAGLYVGMPPYGYRQGARVRVVYADQTLTGYSLEIDPLPATVIRETFAAIVAGETLVARAQTLNSAEPPLPAPRGGAWSNDILRELVRRAPVYAGYVIYRGTAQRNERWGGTLYRGLHPAIVAWDTVKAVLAALGHRLAWEIAPEDCSGVHA